MIKTGGGRRWADRVVVSVPHRATWVGAGRERFSMRAQPATGTVHPECTVGLECTVPAIPIESGDDLLWLLQACNTNGSEQRCRKWRAQTRGAVPRATAAHSPVRAVRARGHGTGRACCCCRRLGAPCTEHISQELIGTERGSELSCRGRCARTYSWPGSPPSTSFPVRWRVVISGSLCQGWPRRRTGLDGSQTIGGTRNCLLSPRAELLCPCSFYIMFRYIIVMFRSSGLPQSGGSF